MSDLGFDASSTKRKNGLLPCNKCTDQMSLPGEEHILKKQM